MERVCVKRCTEKARPRGKSVVNSDRSSASIVRLPFIISLSLVLANGALVGRLLMQTLISQLIISGALFIFVLMVALLLRHSVLTILAAPLRVCLAGGIGMLVGCIADFGDYGIFNLASICVISADESAIDSAARMFRIAPWTHVGMLVSCSLALVISDHYSANLRCKRGERMKHGLCVAGMMVGMWVVICLLSEWTANFGIGSVFYPVATMWFGMSIGMTAPLLLLEYHRELGEFLVRTSGATWKNLQRC